MTPDDLARIHADCFQAHPRPWSAHEFAQLLTGSGSFLLAQPQGFLLGRVIADEAELLTLAVLAPVRRQGTGQMLVQQFLAQSAQRGASTAFLEVASDNLPAQGLYARTGWVQAGRRRNYYATAIDALVLRHDLSPDKTVDGQPAFGA
jgi:ribosomal-protein-alanine N-acetyltransferase